MEEAKKEPIKLSVGLVRSAIGGVCGYLLGRAFAWINPFFPADQIANVRKIRKEGVPHFSDCSVYVAAAAGYAHGWYNIASDIARDPKNFDNYVPIAVNLAVLGGAGAKLLYDRRKKQGNLEVELSK